MTKTPGQTKCLSKLLGVVLVLFSSVAPGQNQPSATYVGEHRIGETFEEWLLISHKLDDLDAACNSRKREDKSRCKYMRDLRDGKLQEPSTGDDDRDYTWKFVEGKLSKVTIYIPGRISTSSHRPDIQQEILFLAQKYGQPTKTDTVAYQNSYGAKWDCLKVNWLMPDGTTIFASEHIGASGGFYGPRRELIVIFFSKEMMERLMQEQQSKPNPYNR